MKRLAFLLLLTGIGFISRSQSSYRIEMNLSEVTDDQVLVRLYPPALASDTATYYMPLIIPGSYEIKDYNRFVKKFKAYDKAGKALKFQKVPSGYRFTNARQIDKIEYLVNDSWDDKKKNYVFQPGGTNIDADKKNYVINHFGFYGYFDGYKNVPYQIDITKSPTLYGSGSLQRTEESTPVKDVFYAEDYPTLADNPLMYCLPDTCSFMAGNTVVRVSSYSGSNVVKSAQICEMLKPLSVALTNFFGVMPVNEYNFIFYFSGFEEKLITRYGGYGALEHNYSSFYFLPEQHNPQQLEEMVMDVAAHEFLHILTPLNIHSEEIQDFDFVNPDMSQHLWMYEGVTEYFSHLVQVRDSLITEDEFLHEMRLKIIGAKEYKDVSFTTMSKEILKNPYKDMYSNVYDKGALIGLLLDIRINELTELNLKKVMMLLAEKYGPKKPFKDEELIDEIVRLTHPEVKSFFTKYVIGDTPLPYTEYFEKLGLYYDEEMADTIDSYGDLGFKYIPQTDKYVVSRAEPGRNTLGLVKGDEITRVGGIKLTKENYVELLETITEPKHSTTIKVNIRRNGEPYEATGKTVRIPVRQLHYIGEKEGASEAQVALRKRVLYLN